MIAIVVSRGRVVADSMLVAIGCWSGDQHRARPTSDATNIIQYKWHNLPSEKKTQFTMEITRMTATHWPAVKEIYQQGIDTGMATFETEPPSWEVFDKKFLEMSRLVTIENNIITGWIALVQVSARECYRGIAEISVYIHKDYWNKGIGRALLQQASDESEQNGYWSLLSVIHKDNAASIHLHEKCGYRIIGYRERIACLNGKWKTTVMMEKRSNIIGI
jgi:L-amino acid N-acyltransferase YncA